MRRGSMCRSGPGAIRAAGRALPGHGECDGTGTFGGDEHPAVTSNRDSGAGQVVVWATATLAVDISGSGAVSY